MKGIPEFEEQYHLPISTHRPKWAMVDMQTGQVFVLDPEGPPDQKHPIGAKKEDLALLRKALK